MDFVTGSDTWPTMRDPGEREPLGIYWYEYLKADDGKSIQWVKHVVDYVPAPAAACRLRSPTSMATAILISSSAARVDYSYSRTLQEAPRWKFGVNTFI